MDDLYALHGGSNASKWQKRHGRYKELQSRIKQKRAKQALREEKFDREECRKRRIARIEQDERRQFLQRRRQQGYVNPQLPYKDLTGRVFGRLKVVRPAGHNPSGSKRWWVRCRCGSPEKQVAGTNLQQGILRSCGCLVREAVRKSGLRRRAKRATKLRRQIRTAILAWRRCCTNNLGDHRLLSLLNKVLERGQSEIGEKIMRRRKSRMH